MKSVFILALLASATAAQAQTPASAASAPASPASPAKKELVAKVIVMEQPLYENMARELIMRPIAQLGQAVGNQLQTMPQDKRDPAAKSIDADMHKFVDEAVPQLRDRAAQLAPTVMGPILEDKMTEDELKQLVTWLGSPAAKKYSQIGGEMQQALGQKLLSDASPMLTPKFQALEQRIRVTLGVVPPGDPSAASAPPAKAAAAPAKKASGK
jgi:uncharacterized protein